MCKYPILLVIIVYSLLSTYSHAKAPVLKVTREQSMQHFNIEEFNKNKDYDNSWVGTDKEGNYLMQAKYDDTYIEEWSPINSPYLYRTTSVSYTHLTLPTKRIV